MGTGGGPTLAEPFVEPDVEPVVEPDVEPVVEPDVEPVVEPEPELPRETITLTLQVELEELSDDNQEEIRNQITDLINDLLGTDLLFEPFESGSTVVKVSSTTPINNVELINKINDPLYPKTITYTGDNGEITTFYTKIGEEVIEYKNDIIIVKTDNTKQIGSVGEDGIVTRAIIDGMIGTSDNDRNIIQCLLFGGNSIKIEDNASQDDATVERAGVFSMLSSLHTVHFGPVTNTGLIAFNQCFKLKNIHFGMVNNIGYGSFFGSNGIKNLNFENVQSIESHAFKYCTSLISLDFKNVHTIQDETFEGCSSLTALDLKNVQQIGSNCFRYCESIQTIDFGLLETIPNAFKYCTSLISLDFKNVHTIQDYAFADSSIQTSIDFGIVTFIGRYVFNNCSLPSTLNFKNVETVDNFAFQDCSKVTSIDFGKVNRIDGYAFTRCLELTSIYLREVLTFNINLFAGCTSLNEVRVDFVDSWDGNFPQTCFQNCPVVDGTEEHPFLIHKDIPNISFGRNNGNFSNLSTVDGSLVLDEYPEDTNYKRVTIRL